MHPYISQIIRSNLLDLKDHYISEYGPVPNWTDIQKNIFFLNCDTDLEYVLKYFKIVPHATCGENGLSYGIMVLQTATMENFLEDKGAAEINLLDIDSREELNMLINENIYKYVLNGITGI
jgi:hypothetical protein